MGFAGSRVSPPSIFEVFACQCIRNEFDCIHLYCLLRVTTDVLTPDVLARFNSDPFAVRTASPGPRNSDELAKA